MRACRRNGALAFELARTVNPKRLRVVVPVLTIGLAGMFALNSVLLAAACL